MAILEVRDLVKRFKCYASPADRLKEILLRKPRHREFTALDRVRLTLKKGQSSGVIIRNGSGKSTLLKILAGVLLPDGGTVAVHGRVTRLLDLGTGFHGEFTGRENIRHNMTLLGMRREDIETRMEAVEAFAELGPFLDEPLKIYSSSMVMRLAFSVAVHADPDVFLIDEAPAVGDAYFQQKCTERIRRFREEGGSLLFASHDMTSVKLLCDKVLVLDHGKVAGFVDPDAMVQLHNLLLARKGTGEDRVAVESTATGCVSYRSMKVRIQDVGLSLPGVARADVIPSGDPVTVHGTLEAREAVSALTVGMMIRNRFGQDVFGTNTCLMGERLSCRAGEQLEVRFECAPWNLGPGQYTLTVAAHRSRAHIHGCCHWMDGALTFQVVMGGGFRFAGMARLPMTVRVTRDGEEKTLASPHAP